MAKDDIEKLEPPDTETLKTTSKKKTKTKGSGRVGKWFREMRSELNKVVWPTPKQIVNNTSVALAVMAISAVAIWALDYSSSQIFQAIITYIPRLIRG